MWNRIKTFLAWALGYGGCFSCGKASFLTHFREIHRDKAQLQEVRYEAYLCRKCLKDRSALWDKRAKELYGDFDRMFEDFDKEFEKESRGL
jgi:hypothetical protein